MIQEVLSHYPFPLLTCCGLLLFLGLFLAALGWVFRQGSKNFYHDLTEIPFQESQTQGDLNLGPTGETNHV